VDASFFVRNVSFIVAQASKDSWNWILAMIEQKSSSAKAENVRVLIIDKTCEFIGQILQIQSKKINDSNVVMANTWSTDSILSYDVQYGTGFDDHGNVTASPKSKRSKWKKEPTWRDNQNGRKEQNSDDENILPPNDLIHLTHLHEPAVVYCLRKRYAVDEIYTCTGPILIALNPFKQCNILYSQSVMQMYLERGDRSAGIINISRNSSHKNLNKNLPPHVYAMADDAYRSMMRTLNDGREMKEIRESPNQSILVSGESGAGKTVTTKIIMRYLAMLSKRSTHFSGSHASGKESNYTERTTEQQLLQSNPILESFGNARTLRNDNSSRFGKYIEIQFSENGLLSGASIDTYLLEKVRLVNQAPGERNYHIFYEILAGTNHRERQIFFLDACTALDFKMTSNSGVYDRRDGVQDDNMYEELKKAMHIIGFSLEEQYDTISIACAILHLSNITFVELPDEASDLDVENPFLPSALSMLGVSPEVLREAFCLCSIDAAGETVYKNLSIHQSNKALEATIKAIYSALFTHIVSMVNAFINGDDDSEKAAFIGVLDIFGFEYFGKNSFEQLCINYCNEALQQQFNRFIFKAEQVEYDSEGISWSFISFPDNQDVIDLIEKKHTGILSILDEQCLLGSCTDQSFALATYDKCSQNSRFSVDRKQRASGYFSISHYAGPVEYDSQSFLEKNKDELPKEATELLYSSSIPFLHHLAHILETSTKTANAKKTGGYGRKNSSLVRISVSGQFRSQLRNLRERIEKTHPHYIRCLKPNDVLLPDQFDPSVIADQLKCGGILEAIRVSRVGFPQRYLHDHFLHRYRILASKELHSRNRKAFSSRKNDCEILFESIAKQILDWKDAKQAKTKTVGKENKNYSGSQNNRGSPLKYGYGHLTSVGKINPNQPWNSKRVDSLEAGMQMGKSKVFLKRWAFDLIEKFLSTKKADAATLINSVVRMYLGRCYFFNLVEDYYRENWQYFTPEQQYEIATQRGYYEEEAVIEKSDQADTNGLVERFEGLQKAESWKRGHHFKWQMVDGIWRKY